MTPATSRTAPPVRRTKSKRGCRASGISFSSKLVEAREIARVFCPAPGRPPSGLAFCRPRNARARGTPGPDSPAALCTVGKQVHRRSHHENAGYPGVPRAVFIGLLRKAPGGRTFQAPILTAGAPNHRFGAFMPRRGNFLALRLRRTLVSSPPEAQGLLPRWPRHSAPVTARSGSRDLAAWTAAGVRSAASPTPPTATAPRPSVRRR